MKLLLVLLVLFLFYFQASSVDELTISTTDDQYQNDNSVVKSLNPLYSYAFRVVLVDVKHKDRGKIATALIDRRCDYGIQLFPPEKKRKIVLILMYDQDKAGNVLHYVSVDRSILKQLAASTRKVATTIYFRKKRKRRRRSSPSEGIRMVFLALSHKVVVNIFCCCDYLFYYLLSNILPGSLWSKSLVWSRFFQ